MAEEVISGEGGPDDVGIIPQKPFELTDKVIDKMFVDTESAPAMGSSAASEAARKAEPEPEPVEEVSEEEEVELAEAEKPAESKFQKRLRKMLEKREAEIEATLEAKYTAKLDELLDKHKADKAPEQAKTVEEAIRAEVERAFPRPKMQDFEDMEIYEDARDTWRDKRRQYEATLRMQVTQRQEQTKREVEVRRKHDVFVKSKDAAAAEKYDGFLPVANGVGRLMAESVAGANDNERQAAVVDAIQRLYLLENFADVVVYLGNHPDEVKTIMGQPDADDRAFEIKALSRKLKSENFNPKEKQIKSAAPRVESPGSGVVQTGNFQKALAAAKSRGDGDEILDLVASRW